MNTIKISNRNATITITDDDLRAATWADETEVDARYVDGDGTMCSPGDVEDAAIITAKINGHEVSLVASETAGDQVLLDGRKAIAEQDCGWALMPSREMAATAGYDLGAMLAAAVDAAEASAREEAN